MPDIKIFSRTGELLVTAENCPEELRERFPVLQRAYNASVAADILLEQAKDSVANCTLQAAAAERYVKQNFPPRGDAGRIADLKAMIVQRRIDRFGS